MVNEGNIVGTLPSTVQLEMDLHELDRLYNGDPSTYTEGLRVYLTT